MRICEAFQTHMTFSFEVFPPKADKPIEPLMETLAHLYPYRPDFISCTYGAGGTNKGRQVEILDAIQKSGRAEPLAHFTCIGNTKADIKKSMEEYAALGVDNFLAIRGDLPADWEGTRGDFCHADALMTYLKRLRPGICMAGACYVEKHISAPSIEADIAHLRTKQDNGAEFLMTQLCHDVDAYARFRERIGKANITLPVVVGLMPVLNKDAIIRMTLTNGCSIPSPLAAIIGKYGNNPEDFKKAGKDYTAEQIWRFVSAGIDGLHFYSLNKYQDVLDIIEASGLRHAE